MAGRAGRLLTVVVCASLAASASTAGASTAGAATSVCARSAAGGDWPMYGHDLSNTRSQPGETAIPPLAAATLTPAWSFYDGRSSGVPALNVSDFNSTPTVAGGCVYVGSAQNAAGAPNVYALDADTGQVVWQVHLDAPDAALGGALVGALTVSGNTVYALVNQRGDGTLGPYVAALNRLTGAVRWRSAPIVTDVGNYTNATPTVANGVVIAGFSAAEGNPFGHGGLALVDSGTGQLLARTYTVPPSQWGTAASPLYAGGGIWTTPAVDAAAGYAYMGSGNPFSKQIQYPRTDALLKVDIRRSRPTFGQIVAFYPGNIDQFSPVLKSLTSLTCKLLPDDPLRTLPLPDPRLMEIRDVISNSLGCLQLDLDFGAAPNLFRSPTGRLVVGDLQKSGVYHAAYADTMTRAWTSTLGISCTVCNADSTAYAGGSVYVNSTPGTLMDSINAATGRLRWLGIVGDLVHYESVSVADGVVYSTDGLGFLDAFRADNGLPLLRRSMVLDVGLDALPPSGYASNGVAIARHTVYVEAGSHVIAYRPKALLGH